MAWNYTRIDDHTAFTAAALNTPFAAARTAVNAVPANDIPDGAFRQEHLVSLVVDKALDQITADTQHRYCCTEPQVPNNAYHYAPYPGYGSDSLDLPSPNLTWHRITNDITDATAYLQVAFAPAINLADTTIGGILVLANVATKTIGQTFDHPGAPGHNYDTDVYGVWTIFALDGGGTWRNIDRAERYRCCNMDDLSAAPENYITTNDDISIRTLIRLTDLPGANKTVSAIAVACACAHTRGHALCAQQEDDYAYVECQRGNLAALVLQSSRSVL